MRDAFWLYLVNNLRADLPADPYVRAIHDPFGTLIARQTSDATVRRAVQFRVQEFEEAEQLALRPKAWRPSMTEAAEPSPTKPNQRDDEIGAPQPETRSSPCKASSSRPQTDSAR